MTAGLNTGLTPSGERLSAADGCAREPVHIIGCVQSHGALFALSEPDLVVRHVSANVSELFDLAVDRVLGASFADVLGAAQFALFCAHLQSGDDLLTANPLRMRVGGHALEVNCVAHRYDDWLIAELEQVAGAHSLEPLNFVAHIGLPVSRMERATDVDHLSQAAAAEIRRLSGFDRVMVYRFDEAWNGEVIAESGGSSGLSYLGLRFPASDIPAQARRLFLLNPLRAIADVASEPVPIVRQLGPLTQRPLDLTHSFLRSASPVHIAYLRNMEVRSTLTVSISVEGRLWGMIACHDPAPRPIDWLTRSVCELIGRVLASQLALRIENAALQARLASQKLLETYMAGIEASTSLFHSEPFQAGPLLALLDADGLVSSIGGVISRTGVTVDGESLLPIIAKLRRFAARGIASSDRLGVFDASAQAYAATASGALYLGLVEGSGEFLLLLRRELVQTVTWAGNPDKAVNADADGTLHPRTSFAAWRETVRGHARPWNELQLQSARYLREQMLRLRALQHATE